jgi:EAL domain-containing protein (putative c-di-GMP-specific phosphodiesterase class I)/ActR/RegA family two-component response regulator
VQTFLIVDDDPQVGSGLAAALEARGRDIIVCRDFEAAQMVVERYPLTHVITDIKFTGPFRFEGLDVVDLVKRYASTASIIVMSGHVTAELRAEAHARGAAAVLAKPFPLASIERLLPAPPSDGAGTVTFVPTIDEIIEDDLLAPVFQPLVWTENPNYAVGFEALTRLRSTSLFFEPETLFRYAMAKGRVADLELAAAARSIDMGRWLSRLGVLSLNIHPLLFAEADRFSDSIMQSCLSAGVSPDRVVLEITEQAPLPDVQTVEAVTAVMRSHGFRFAFDDVGSAYSHLRAMSAVRPAYLKISQHFGTACEGSDLNRKIVENVTALGRSFSSEVVLEGIETEETALFARELGIRFGQGFLYGRPTDTATLLAKYG